MGFLDRVAAGAEFRALSTLRNPQGWLTDALGGRATFAGERVSMNDAFGLGPVYAAVTIIAETVGGLPFKVYRAIQDTDERVEARTHRMWRVLHDKPNEITPADRFWSTVTAQLLLHGNAFVRKERNDFGEVEQLWLIDPASVTVEWDGARKTFVEDNGQTRRRRWSDEQVLHIFSTSLNGLVGESPISRCREVFGTAIARSKFEGGFYRRGARAPAVIQHPGRLGERGTKNLSQTFKAWHGGVDNMHQVPVLEEGAVLNALSMPLTDMEFVASQQLSRSEIANIFHLPASYLNASTGDSITYATIESNSIQFAQLAIAPPTNTIAKAIASDPMLFPQNVVYPEFVLEGLLKADQKSRAEYWEKLHGMNVVDEAYIASRENLPAPPEKPKPPPIPPPPLPADGSTNGSLPPELAAQAAAAASS